MDDLVLRVNEIFTSISGEINIWPQGTPVVFLRLAGCNLKCKYCDTKSSLKMDHGAKYSISNLIDEIKRRMPIYPKVIVTGGEPLLQKETLKVFLEKCKINNIPTVIETNGSIQWPAGEYGTWWMVDYKLCQPEKTKMLDIEYFSRAPNTYVKFVVQTVDQFKDGIKVLAEMNLRHVPLWSAAYPMTPKKLFELLQEYEVPGVLNVQIHKLIGMR